MRFDVLADWRINYSCNFNCVYHRHEIRQNGEHDGCYSIDKIIDGFNNSRLVWLIHMSGGEPFLHPRFVELCEELTEQHYISIDTNLSTQNVYEFAARVDPKKVAFVNCSLHMSERERLGLVEDFIKKFHVLQAHGFNGYVGQVMYPPELERFHKIFDLFKTNGITVIPRVFRGYYRRKRYPSAYSEEERKVILQFTPKNKLPQDNAAYVDHGLDDKYLHGDLSFKGLPCSAGSDFVVIRYDGDVVRCHGEQTRIGNIIEGGIELLQEAKPCPATVCPWPYHGLNFVDGNYKVVKADGILDALHFCKEYCSREKVPIWAFLLYCSRRLFSRG